MKPVLHLQPYIFWEDSGIGTNNFIAASKYFEVVSRSENEINNPLAEMRLAMGARMRGSLAMARKMGFTFPYADAMNWLPALREHCVNSDAIFTDLKYAKSLVDHSGSGNRFLRPASGFKTFGGGEYSSEMLAKEISWLDSQNLKPESVLCVVATPKRIDAEWRCIFVNGRYVSGSQYKSLGENHISREVPEEVVERAKEIASNEFFTNVFDFVLDIGSLGKGKHNLKLVEVNAFETSSFYDADLDAIYKAWAEPIEIF